MHMHPLVANPPLLKDGYCKQCVSFSLYQEFIKKCKERDSESIGTGLPIIVSDNEEYVCHSPEDLEGR